LKELKIIPKHIWHTIPPENFRLSKFNLEPVGNGPYKFEYSESRKNGFITIYRLSTNENFSLKKPFIKEFEVKFYPNETELIDAFNNKKVDGFGGVNPKNISKIELNHKVLEKPVTQYYAIFLNKETHPSLEDKDILEALMLSINKERIVEEVFNGKASLINQPILPIIPGYDKSTELNSGFSLEKASEILDEGKWKINEETGIREKKSRNETLALNYSIVVPDLEFLNETAKLIKEDWGKIGVQLNIITISPLDIINEVIKNRNYQMLIFGNILKNNPDIFAFWHSSERFYPGLNLALYNNKKVDDLLESIRKNSDEELRKEELTDLQSLINKDRPALFLYSPTYVYAAPKSFGGFDQDSINMPSDRFKNVHEWYLETTRTFK